jgi:DNA-binding CsgD family transcriptional regulator
MVEARRAVEWVRLTPAEQRMVEMLTEDRSNSEIAEAFGLSASGVRSMLYRVRLKVGAQTDRGLVMWAQYSMPD